jgi:hypothetical protein
MKTNDTFTLKCSTSEGPVQREKTIIDDDFMEEVFGKILNFEHVKSVYQNANITKVAETNIHDSKIIDFVITITEGKDSIRYYLGNGRKILLEAFIISHKLDAPPFLFRGQSLSSFHQKFGFHDDLDILNIETSEYTETIKLIFSNGTLVTFHYETLYLG